MKTLTEQIEWYRRAETRAWKRLWYCVEFSIMALLGFTILGVVLLYGNGTRLQSVFTVFVIVISLCAAALAIAARKTAAIQRWQYAVSGLGTAGAIGMAAVAAYLMLQLQHASP